MEPGVRSAREAPPVMDQDDLISENSDHNSSKSNEEVEFNNVRAQQIFNNYHESFLLYSSQRSTRREVISTGMRGKMS